MKALYLFIYLFFKFLASNSVLVGLSKTLIKRCLLGYTGVNLCAHKL